MEKHNKIRKALFVGMYPNNVNKYRNVFFQNLIFEIADSGVDCTVISPVPVTKYRNRIKEIPRHQEHTTPKGNKVSVYYPRYISASSKQIGKFNTEKISEALFEKSALKTALSLDGQFDFVYGHFVLYGGLAAIKIGRALHIPSFFAFGECDFYTEVGNTYGLPKPDEIAGLTGIISVSQKNTKQLLDLGFAEGVPVITAPNATNLSLFHKLDKSECRKTLGIPQDKFVVGFVGGFIERKGDKRLMAAVERLDNVYAAFAGRGDNPPSGEKVLFCRPMEHEEVPILLNAADVFVLPTLAEGSCNAIVEAMACGCPIISSDLPFNDDALTDENAIRINPNSVDEIEAAIARVYKDEAYRETLAKRSLETAKHFGITERAEKILDFIESLI